MAQKLPFFTKQEMEIDEIQGFPKAYALLCKTLETNFPFSYGPPFCFIPYVLQPQQELRVKELNQMFPIKNPEICSTLNLKSYADFLWEQLDHIGNAGFDPTLFRVDCFGNVVYRNANSVSPLAWNIDHWFPISRGGKTVQSNLRILQWQVCKKKKNKLDFLIPWWDLQMGISVNQFLAIFSSINSEFRTRALSFLFPHGECEENEILKQLNLDNFPDKFMHEKRKHGFAPAAIVLSKNSSETMVLKSVDLNRSLGQNSPFPESMKSFQKQEEVSNQEFQTLRSSITKQKSQSAKYNYENSSEKLVLKNVDHNRSLAQKSPFPASMKSFQKQDYVTNQELIKLRSSITKEKCKSSIDDYENNPNLTTSCARDSSRHKKEDNKLQAEISELDEELNKLKEQNNIERIAIQELETVLIKRRRRVEHCRRLSEAQGSYRLLLEKMLRDAMHQTVVYKEQIRLNQAATSALIARLVAQRDSCDSAENELRRKHKQREELMLQAIDCSEQITETSKIYDDFNENNSLNLSSIRRAKRKTKKELRAFLEEEQKAFEAGISLSFDKQQDSEKDYLEETISLVHEEDHYQPSKVNKIKDENPLKSKPKGFKIVDESYRRIGDEKKQSSYSCSSSYNAEEGNGANLKTLSSRKINDQKKLKQVQKRKLDDMKINESKKQQNLNECSGEQHDDDDEEYKNQIGKENVEKWLQILLENGSSHSTSRKFDEITNSTNAEMHHYFDKTCLESGFDEKKQRRK